MNASNQTAAHPSTKLLMDEVDPGTSPMGIPSQDPRPLAQVPLTAEESREEAKSTLAGGGVVAGVVTGGAIGTAVGGPVGAVVGATVGAVAGAVGGLAASTAMEESTERDAKV